jgi:hypothetical protein
MGAGKMLLTRIVFTVVNNCVLFPTCSPAVAPLKEGLFSGEERVEKRDSSGQETNTTDDDCVFTSKSIERQFQSGRKHRTHWKILRQQC